MQYKYLIKILFCLFFFENISICQSVDLEKDLALKLTFDGDAIDQSGNNIPTNVVGAILIEDRFGNPNQAYKFDGINDRIVLNNDKPLITSNTFSICMWAKMDGQSFSQKKQNVLFEQRDNDYESVNAKSTIIFSSEVASLTRLTIRGSVVGVQPSIIDDESPEYGEWNHYAVVLQSDKTVSIYINAVLKIEGLYTGNGDLITSIDHVDIGSHQYDNQIKGAFNGVIDNVYIYNRAINECEIGALYGIIMQER